MKNAVLYPIALGLLALFAWGCSDDSNGGECATSAACATYTTCISGACVPLDCEASTDCPTTDVCVQNAEGAFVCTAIECSTDDQCEEDGAICLQNICVVPTAATCAADGDVCQFANDCCSKQCDGETKLCVPFSGCAVDGDCDEGDICGPTGECIPDEGTGACTPETCDGVCNAETGECEASDTGPGICAPCTIDEDCGDAGGCVTLGGLQSCLPTCQSKADCASGFECFNLSPGGFRCVPASFTCDIDCLSGCADGEVCDLDTGNCVTQLGLCDSCDKEYLCGEGRRCVSAGTGTSKICVPECIDGACTEGGSCETVQLLEVCLPSGSECCYGPDCDGSCGDEVCGGNTPYCFSGTTCVECLNSTTCGAGCTCENNSCVCPGDACGACSDPTPICNPQTSECVQCLSNEDCNVAGGQFCNVSTKTCEVDICSACVDPYPACAEINGQFSCVQCTQDSDCASGACNETTYFCEGGTGAAPDTCKCTSDADCPTNTQFTLKCDTSVGLCYDIEGNCDGISACCDVASGSECISIFELFGADGALPGGLPGGATGLCSCSALGELCAIPIPGLCDNVVPGNCMGGQSCTPNLLGLLFGLGSQSSELPSDFCGEL